LMEFPTQKEIITRLIEWGEGQPLVRGMLLTSSRAIPNGPVDVLSDYDVILALSDVRPFYTGRDWLEAFGPVLALYCDPLVLNEGYLEASYVVQFENNLKIDFSLWAVEMLQRIATDPVLPPEFDAGYQVLLDKDGLTAGLQPPAYAAYIPKPPTETEYRERVETFFLDATYAAKFLWRDDLMAAKYILDDMMKQEHLRPMLEWHLETDNNWSVKPGPYGRRLKQKLRPDLWAELETTYTGAGLEENWQALERTIALMRRAALEVGQRLGYAYPHALDRRAVAYLEKVKELD
jgi:aminoglycoside 6-adenylyltransferase